MKLKLILQLVLNSILITQMFISCKNKSFDGINFYIEQSIKNQSLISTIIDSISSNDYINQTSVFSCDTKEKNLSTNNKLCETLRKGNFREAIVYNTGTIHIVYNRLLKNQSYGVYIMNKSNLIKDTSTKKVYYHNLVGTKYVLVGEMDW